jgi:putative transposase
MKTKNHVSQTLSAPVDPKFLPPEELWEAFEKLLPPPMPKPKGGRPSMPAKQAFFAIFYVLRTGIQWKALPKSLGAGSTVHGHFQKWVRSGIFKLLWSAGLYLYDENEGVDWEWLAMDGAITKAPLGGENTGPNPTDRAKQGTKRHVLTDGNGVPLALVATGANRNDFKEIKNVLDNIVIQRPQPTKRKKQNLCLDKGYDYPEVHELIKAYGYTGHIKTRGEESSAKAQIPGYRARRWVVERTHSWMNRFRRLLIRWEKKTANYETFLHLSCAFITFRAAGAFG